MWVTQSINRVIQGVTFRWVQSIPVIYEVEHWNKLSNTGGLLITFKCSFITGWFIHQNWKRNISWMHKCGMRCLVDCYWSAIHFWAMALIIWWALILPWEADPPESAVPLTNADTTQHSLLVHHVLPQELADNVSAQTEAHHDQLRLRVRPLNVANHGGKLPCATWMGERRGEQLIFDTAGGQPAAPRSAVPLTVPLSQGIKVGSMKSLHVWHFLFNSRCFAFWLYIWDQYGSILFLPKN